MPKEGNYEDKSRNQWNFKQKSMQGISETKIQL